ncbi:uncharacterized protein FOBCDRAFT_241383 [Fusarium oxysporum Fo47]|uniref:uncharacterized protein n=1 Tax=Fusarium oxysporum Fo47 TaxID=660027 RepID=UPI00286995A7|nr:uncharacterized protein FOBCDRAFT_241383 [Fusarium oxysporum Fo47]WJG35611.1 hypothetical protein FOBCDRAFT_241383 [Fusarium oxysporum Fo47]
MTKDVLEKMNTKTPSFDLGMAEEADVGYTRGREACLLLQTIEMLLSAMIASYLHVDQYIDDDNINGCSYISASCVAGPPENLQSVLGAGGISANAGLDWYLINAGCRFTEQDLAQYDQFGVAFGFTCYNTGVNLDAVTFGPI